MDPLLRLFFVYCFLPLFIFGLVYVLALRDIHYIVDLKEVMKDLLRKYLD